jgi:chemotaxis methyl-accepting protein methylase
MHFDAFLQQICPRLDLEWRKYRRRAARHRVQKRMAELGLEDYGAYLAYLTIDGAEAAVLAERMAVSVSRFFREAQVWEALEDQILPRLLAGTTGRRYLRAWSVGCAGGEEPYSLALLWIDRLRFRYPWRRLSILASDCDAVSLRRARRACYAPSSLRELRDGLRNRWFADYGNLWRLSPRVTGQVRFLRHNFMTDPPPGSFDLILARYLPFTYYRGARRLRAVRRLWRALRPGGVLMIGAKESLREDERRLFAPCYESMGIYRRRSPGAGGAAVITAIRG